jgi:hypothetical protein
MYSILARCLRAKWSTCSLRGCRAACETCASWSQAPVVDLTGSSWRIELRARVIAMRERNASDVVIEGKVECASYRVVGDYTLYADLCLLHRKWRVKAGVFAGCQIQRCRRIQLQLEHVRWKLLISSVFVQDPGLWLMVLLLWRPYK